MITTYLLIAVFALAFLLLWAGSVALITWDARRRRLGRLGRWLGIGVAVVLPIAGAMAYGMFLLIAHWMKPAPQTQERSKRRVTQPIPVQRPPGVRPTIPGAEMIQSTISFSSVETANKPIATAGWAGYQVTVVEGPNAGEAFRLNQFPAGIGRNSAALVILDKDLKVSRRHAEIYQDREAVRLRDLGSLHGTQVNGLPIQDHILQSGDRIQLGASVLVFQAAEG
jgi:FHA domain